jgi:hypothetical protein
LKNGAVRGAVVGAIVGGALIAAALTVEPCGRHCALVIGATLLGVSGAGAAIGTAFDALHSGRTVIWQSSGQEKITLSFGISAEPNRVAANASVRW